MPTVLAVINHWPTAQRLIDRSREIASAIGGEVHVYCPVSSQIEEMNRHVGFSNLEEVKAELMAECEARLEELTGVDDLNTDVEWQDKPYRGVAARAQAVAAEMILMSRSEHHMLGDFLHRPDDWHLLRDAPCPVLILSREPSTYHGVTAAVDAMEDDETHHALNGRILDQARRMAEIFGLPLRVVTVVPEPTYVYSGVSAIDSTTISRFRDEAAAIARARQQRMLSRLGIAPSAAQVLWGQVDRELQHCLAESGLLVMGTIANKGLKGFFIGNTSERLLSHLEGELLVVN